MIFAVKSRREMIKDMCDLVRNKEHAEDDVGNDAVDTNITEVIQCEEVILSSVIENLQHRDYTIRTSVCPIYMRTRCPHIMDMKPYPTSPF
jgi:hypothetical protein